MAFVVMVENKDNTVTPKIGGIPQLLEEHKIGCDEPFEELLLALIGCSGSSIPAFLLTSFARLSSKEVTGGLD